MHVARLRSWLLISCAAAVLTVGCGQGNSLSPTAPTALPDVSESGFDGDADAGVAASSSDEFAALGKGSGGSTNSGGGHKDKDSDTERSERGKGGKGRDGTSAVDDDDEGEDDEEDEDGERNGRRSVVGFVTAVGADSLTIRGVTVKVTSATVIRHGNRRLTLTQVAVGDHAQAKGTWNTDGSLTASEVKVEDTGRDNEDGEEAKVSGTVAGLTGTCPGLTFTVGTTTVKTDVSTTFKDVTCATLANGASVDVKGLRQTDGSILATEVKLKHEEVEGAVSDLSGSCPSLTFKLGTTVVKAGAATTYEDGTCAGIANGVKVEVEGVKQADGSILAVEIEFDFDELEGTITDLTGTCPSLTFKIGTTTVTTSASTTFSGGACSALANGTKVEVKGTLSGTTLAAARVEID